MESRQSRMLGENVELLTFVSIFFLPLAFAVALWSIPDMSAQYPGISTPLIVTAVLGIITYLIVWNLKIIVSMLSRLVERPRAYLLTMMKVKSTTGPYARTPESKQWARRADRFEVFPRKDEDGKPSTWWLLLYPLRRLYVFVMRPFVRSYRYVLDRTRRRENTTNRDGSHVGDQMTSIIASELPGTSTGVSEASTQVSPKFKISFILTSLTKLELERLRCRRKMENERSDKSEYLTDLKG